MSTLDEVLSNEPVPAAAPVAEVPRGTIAPTEPQAAQPVAAPAPRDATGKFAPIEPAAPAPAATPTPTPPSQDMTAKERAFLAAATEERRKRQDLERQLQEYQAKPKEPEKPFWDDPDAAVRRIDEKNQEVMQHTQNAVTGTKLQVSEFIARKTHPDFDEKYEEFRIASTEHPYLLQQMVNDPDPAEFVYKTAKMRLELREVGDVESLRDKIRKEERIKLEEEFKKKEADAAALRSEIPTSLSQVTGTPGQNRPVWSGPTSLSEILGR